MPATCKACRPVALPSPSMAPTATRRLSVPTTPWLANTAGYDAEIARTVAIAGSTVVNGQTRPTLDFGFDLNIDNAPLQGQCVPGPAGRLEHQAHARSGGLVQRLGELQHTARSGRRQRRRQAEGHARGRACPSTRPSPIGWRAGRQGLDLGHRPRPRWTYLPQGFTSPRRRHGRGRCIGELLHQRLADAGGHEQRPAVAIRTTRVAAGRGCAASCRSATRPTPTLPSVAVTDNAVPRRLCALRVRAGVAEACVDGIAGRGSRWCRAPWRPASCSSRGPCWCTGQTAR